MKPLPFDYITEFEPVGPSRSTEVTARAMGSRKLVPFILNSLVPTFRPMWKANCLAHHFTNTDKFLISAENSLPLSPRMMTKGQSAIIALHQI